MKKCQALMNTIALAKEVMHTIPPIVSGFGLFGIFVNTHLFCHWYLGGGCDTMIFYGSDITNKGAHSIYVPQDQCQNITISSSDTANIRGAPDVLCSQCGKLLGCYEEAMDTVIFYISKSGNSSFGSYDSGMSKSLSWWTIQQI